MATLAIKVVPGASRDRVVGRYGDAVKVQVNAAPEAGKANKAVVRILAEFLNVKPDQIEITRGHGLPWKIVEVSGMSQAEVDLKVGRL
jgi:uncharacterized protein (TIGR00251 family)